MIKKIIQLIADPTVESALVLAVVTKPYGYVAEDEYESLNDVSDMSWAGSTMLRSRDAEVRGIGFTSGVIIEFTSQISAPSKSLVALRKAVSWNTLSEEDLLRHFDGSKLDITEVTSIIKRAEKSQAVLAEPTELEAIAKYTDLGIRDIGAIRNYIANDIDPQAALSLRSGASL
jgi:hypothetical protein